MVDDENWRKILVDWKGSRSYENFAEELRSHGMKVTPQSIHKWVKGGGGINTATAKDLAKIRGMKVDEFLYGRPAAITERQRAWLELINGLPQKQEEKHFRELQNEKQMIDELLAEFGRKRKVTKI